MNVRISLLVTAFVCVTQLFATASPQYAADRILARFASANDAAHKHNANPVVFDLPAIDALNAKYGCVHAYPLQPAHGMVPQGPVFAFQFAHDVNIDDAVREYMQTGQFVYVEPDFIGNGFGQQVIPNDPEFNKQWALHNDGSFTKFPAKAGADIDMEDAWGIEQGDSNVIVCIIDTGVKLDHPELDGRIWHNYAEIAGNTRDDDNNGFVDDVVGWNFAYNNNNPTDDEGHGTNVAGIIGAKGNNGVGVAGMDWHCKLMICKGLDSLAKGFYSVWASAMYYAIANGARVINMSLGGSSSSQTLQDAVNSAIASNVLVVVAMGNNNNAVPEYPANCTGVMAVGSTSPDDMRTNPFFWSLTSGSNFGNNISVVAPGNYIYGLDAFSNTDYTTYWGGTSQATPHVVALAALLLAQNDSRTPAQVRNIIEVTAVDQVGDPTEDTPGWDQYYGHGRINAGRALAFGKSLVQSVLPTSSSLTLSPNPSHGLISIQHDAMVEPARVTVTNVLGRIISSDENVRTFPFTLNLRDATPGTYFVEMTTGAKREMAKVVVQ